MVLYIKKTAFPLRIRSEKRLRSVLSEVHEFVKAIIREKKRDLSKAKAFESVDLLPGFLSSGRIDKKNHEVEFLEVEGLVVKKFMGFWVSGDEDLEALVEKEPVDDISSDAVADDVGGFEEEEMGVLGVEVGGGGESSTYDNNRGLGVWQEWGFWGVDSCLEK
ncbi:hypothetical protein C1H46_037388 [Malus baccata]|uniref:Uncharacterized protein n=1 Tax=Malus baccata TaxID=106549 RepID=A0A540KS63_MALBA|nr:hypothetical protein C1H46_037388 [Malus baccata]